MAIEVRVSPFLTVWNTLRVVTGIGGAYMIGSRCALVAPMPLSALVGTTSSRGTVLLRGAMPFTSLSWPTVMPCFLAIDSKLSPFLGW